MKPARIAGKKRLIADYDCKNAGSILPFVKLQESIGVTKVRKLANVLQECACLHNAVCKGGRGATIRWVCVLLMFAFCTAVVQAQPQDDGSAMLQAVEQMRAGLEQHNVQIMLSAFDERTMQNYARFREQLRAYFQQNESFRARTRVLGTESSGDRASSLIEIELEAQPAGGNGPATRKSGQLRVELIRAGNVWKIRELTPRSFFQ